MRNWSWRFWIILSIQLDKKKKLENGKARETLAIFEISDANVKLMNLTQANSLSGYDLLLRRCDRCCYLNSSWNQFNTIKWWLKTSGRYDRKTSSAILIMFNEVFTEINDLFPHTVVRSFIRSYCYRTYFHRSLVKMAAGIWADSSVFRSLSIFWTFVFSPLIKVRWINWQN